MPEVILPRKMTIPGQEYGKLTMPPIKKCQNDVHKKIPSTTMPILNNADKTDLITF